MLSVLAKSIREYKKPSLLAPLLVSGEVVMECIIPFVTANLVNQIKAGCSIGVIVQYGAVLVVMAGLSLTFGALAGSACATASCGFARNLRKDMFYKIQDYSFENIDKFSVSSLVTRMTTDVTNVQMAYMMIVRTAIRCPLMLVFSFVMAFIMGGKMAVIFLLVIPVLGVGLVLVVRRIGGGSAKYFVRQQQALGRTEGYIEEMMNGQKVVKVFCHEQEAKRAFDAINDALFSDAEKANRYANMLMPILNNIGNVLYVVVALAGGILLLSGAPNLSISGLAFSISIVVPFLNMTKQFSGNVSQVSNQINSIVMGLAGTQRIFALIDEQPETDEGYVTLVNAKEGADGTLEECAARTNVWAWKHPHGDGTTTYTRLTGDVRLFDVDFAYEEGKTVLHDVTLYAKPGQKVACVGSTGAGKTTITNLINRFYDIADGKIRYDGININKIKKADLRRSLGVVLQDTNLFTGTVMDNIRYGRLDACDEECIAAAKLAGAHDFITRLPQGYDTPLSGNGASLSQGQRQLLAIARAAVADPPVMILDEATSSIDTRTEAIVQRGMDALMTGRTVFVIAHRLSTVKNADAIMVLDHGRIIERGTHDELLALKGTYYQLYTGALELD